MTELERYRWMERWIREHRDDLQGLMDKTWAPKRQEAFRRRESSGEDTMEVADYVCYHLQHSIDILSDALDLPPGWIEARRRRDAEVTTPE